MWMSEIVCWRMRFGAKIERCPCGFVSISDVLDSQSIWDLFLEEELYQRRWSLGCQDIDESQTCRCRIMQALATRSVSSLKMCTESLFNHFSENVILRKSWNAIPLSNMNSSEINMNIDSVCGFEAFIRYLSSSRISELVSETFPDTADSFLLFMTFLLFGFSSYAFVYWLCTNRSP